jgi:exodeoxyribonuclease VII large subunit
MENNPLSVSDAIAYINQTLDYAYPVIVVEGEIASFKVNQDKFVFFDVIDSGGTLNCFMMKFQLRTQLEDGMKVRVTAQPKLTNKGRFSLTVRDVRPIGEGSLKRAYELLKTKLEGEGLFVSERKRALPAIPRRIGVISSTQAAGYGDFVTIIRERWGDLELVVAHTQVQGESAAQQIIRALDHFNQMAEPVDVIAILRGGGSADDLNAFNDESLVRAVASSRIATISGIGHEVDTSLVDMAADVRASTPSNAAQLLVPDRHAIYNHVNGHVDRMLDAILGVVRGVEQTLLLSKDSMLTAIDRSYEATCSNFSHLSSVLSQLNPKKILSRGYALIFDEQHHSLALDSVRVGQMIEIEGETTIVKAGVENVRKKSTS